MTEGVSSNSNFQPWQSLAVTRSSSRVSSDDPIHQEGVVDFDGAEVRNWLGGCQMDEGRVKLRDSLYSLECIVFEKQTALDSLATYLQTLPKGSEEASLTFSTYQKANEELNQLENKRTNLLLEYWVRMK